MRKPWLFLLALLAFSPAVHGEEAVRHVVLISVDGLAASYLDDPRADLPTLRMLAKQGAAAKGMVTAFPSVTWPAHVTLVTGTSPRKHGVIGNGVLDRRTGKLLTYLGDPVLTKDEAIRVPTLYDVAHAAGMKTASVIWPCSNGAKTLDWVIPDSNKAELHAKYTTPGFAQELAAAGIDIAPLGKWGWDKKYSTPRDELYSQVARHLLAKHRPGLLLLHYITPDGVEHAYGPHTPEAYQAVAESDRRVKEVWDVLQKPPFAGKAALFVVSDHGFAPYEKIVQPNVVLKQLGLVETDEKGKATKRRAWCVSQGGAAFVYLLDDEKGLLPTVREALAKVEGVRSVLEPAAFVKLGLPTPDENPEMAQLVLTTGPGYSFGDAATGEAVVKAGGLKGTHGHLPQPSFMHATFIAAGAGIKPSVQLRTMQSVDIAPTIARLLGLQLPTAEGRVLTEILADDASAARNVRQVIAHRGSSKDRPENTLASFRRAIEAGATATEIDVRMTKDGALVAMHDTDVRRTTDGKGKVSDLTLAEVRRLDAGQWFDSMFAGEKVPTLREVLELCRGKIDVLLDLQEPGEEYARRIADEVRRHGDPKRTVLGVRSVDHARLFRKLLPEARQIGLIPTVDGIDAFADAGVETIRLWPKWVAQDEGLVARVRRHGRQLHLNGTTGDEGEVRALLRHAPESLSSDDPARLVATLARLARR